MKSAKLIRSQNNCLLKLFSRCSTIYALSSGLPPSAIAVVRLSGEESRLALQRLTKRKTFEPRKLFYTPFFGEKDEVLDRAMAVFMPAPATFTGEDTAELYLHGSRAVIDAVCERLSLLENVRPAKAGEFTKRAFFNSKLTLHDVHSLSFLLLAETNYQRSLAIRSQEIGSATVAIREKLVELLCMLEAKIDFAEDVEFDWTTFISKTKVIEEELKLLQLRVEKGALISNGIRAVIIGRTNVGKSSVLNRLTARNVSIVSPIEGTTRDALEVRLEIASIPVTLIDTAGMRETSDPIEVEGIARTKSRVSEADLIIAVFDLETTKNAEKEVHELLEECEVKKGARVLVVFNKCDLARNQLTVHIDQRHTFVSCLNNIGIDKLIGAIGEEISNICGGNVDALLSRERQRMLLKNAIRCLGEVTENSCDLAIIAQDIRSAADAIGEISGAIINDEILDRIFSSFCIGK